MTLPVDRNIGELIFKIRDRHRTLLLVSLLIRGRVIRAVAIDSGEH
jgi:hypothetical protein